MPKTLRTSHPEINKLFPEGLPAIGVTLIAGGTASGKTTLVIDIVRECLRDSTEIVTVLTECPEMWRLAIPDRRLRVGSQFTEDDSRVSNLVVVDGGITNAFVIRFAKLGPVLLTTTNVNTTMAFLSSAVKMLHLERLDGDMGRITVVKGSMLGTKIRFRVDPVEGIVDPDYKPPEVKSVWDRLMGEEDLV
jgi:predicted ATP-dependent serine protease